MNGPEGIAVSGTDLFVANDGTNTVGEYTTSGTTINTSLITGLDIPDGTAVSGSDLFVTNEGSGAVGEYTTSGSTINASLVSGLDGPYSIAVSGTVIFVASPGSNAVCEYDATTGATINASLITGLDTPVGITVSGTDLFVANEDSNTVGEYTTSGHTINASLVTGLDDPVGIAVSGTGLFVANLGSNTSGEYNTTTGAPVTVTRANTSISGGAQSGIAVSVPSGTPVTDSAILGGDNASSAMGTVTYNVYSDAACTHAVSTGTAEPMTAPGTLPASSPVTLATPGIYYWQATYSGDGLNGTSVSTCGLTGEVETVTPKAPVFNSPATATFVKSKHGTFTVHATGYPTTMTFAKTGTLPGGVTLTTTGVLSGTSMVTGTFRFTITASNGVLPNTTQSFTLKVVAIEITTTSLLKATHGVSYSTALEEPGGKSPFKWTATGLPSGLSLAAATGTLSGKANRASVYRVKVTLTDSTTPTKNKATATLTLTVK